MYNLENYEFKFKNFDDLHNTLICGKVSTGKTTFILKCVDELLKTFKDNFDLVILDETNINYFHLKSLNNVYLFNNDEDFESKIKTLNSVKNTVVIADNYSFRNNKNLIKLIKKTMRSNHHCYFIIAGQNPYSLSEDLIGLFSYRISFKLSEVDSKDYISNEKASLLVSHQFIIEGE